MQPPLYIYNTKQFLCGGLIKGFQDIGVPPFLDKSIEIFTQIHLVTGTFVYERVFSIINLALSNVPFFSEKLFTVFDLCLVILVMAAATLYAYFNIEEKRKRNNEPLKKDLKLGAEDSMAVMDAKRIEEFKTQLVSTVAHELRTPLHGMSGIVSIIMEDSDKEQHKLMKSLQFATEYLSSIVDNFLQANRLNNNNIKPKQKLFDLHATCKDIIHWFNNMNKENNNSLCLSIADEIPRYCKGDANLIRLILHNLVDNGLKYTLNGTVELLVDLKGTSDDKIEVQFGVRDNGIGISEKDMELVFNDFHQLNRNTRVFGGVGLGLSTSKKLVELMDGELKVESKESQGSFFYFSLTLQNMGHIEHDKPVSPLQGSDEPRRKKVLVVDDNKINVMVTKKLLEKKNYAISVAYNGEEAVKIVTEGIYPFDLILMDLNMPIMDGFEASRIITDISPTTPIIALTASTIENVAEEVLQAGMVDMLTKPFENNIFYSTVSRHMSGSIIKNFNVL